MPPSVPAGVLDAPLEFRDPLDYSGTRTAVFGAVKDSFKSAFPIDNGTHRLEVADVDYVDPDWFSPADEKKAILERKSLTRRLRGTVSLVDNATGEVIDKAKKTLLHVPYLTDRGTYIKNGSDYTVASQMRLLSGIYARTKDNGEREAHFNVLSGGPPFRVSMDSDTGVYRMFLGGSKLKLYPILRAAGLEDDVIKEKWGRELFEINRAASDGDTSVKKAMAKLASRKEIDENKIPTLPEMLSRIKLDSRVTKRTMDKPYETAEPSALLAATAKILSMSKGEAEDDDRDAMAFQETYGPEDLFAERVQKDAGRVAKKLLIKAAAQRSLKSLGSGALDSYMDQVFYRSGMGAALEEINPLDAADQNMRLLRIGEGAIENEDAIPAAARAVQPSQFLYVDPIRAPESLKIGVDTRMTLGVRRGSDKRMYTPVVNVKTGKTEMRNPDELADLAVVFPQEMEQAQRDGRKRVIAIRGGKTVYVKPEEADYIAPSVSNMFTANSLLIPAMGSIKGGRLLMAAKYLNQALPLENPEAPLVLSRSDDGSPYEDTLSGLVGAHRSKEPGRVVAVGDGVVRVQGPSGVKTYTYYENFPHNRKSRLHSTPMVAVGDTVAAGAPLTRSNYTDQAGRIAMGKNLRIAFLVEPNSNYEDGLAISESAAKKLRSEHLYTEALDQDRQTQVDGAKFLGLFPGAFKKEQLALLGKEGVVKVGQTVNYGDPLVLSVSRRDPKGLGMMSRSAKAAFSDSSVKWTHSDPGIVTDVYKDRDGVKVAVLSLSDTKIADKLVNRFAAKGVVSSIIPDSQMPVGEDGKPFDMVQNPTGVLTRINPAQATAELLLSKIAAKTGKPYIIDPMMDDNLVSYVKEELRKNRITPDEEVWDPQTKRKMRLLTGTMHMTKLHHTAESKMSGRSVGSYTMDGEPARGMGQEDSKPKRMGFGEMAALISHGAVNTIRDARVIRGQRNDEYFRQLLQGNRPPDPGMPNSYKKFRAMLASAGIRVRKENDGAERLMAMTDKDVEAISAGEILKPDTVKWTTSFDRTAMGAKDLDPVADGLFDRGITGGHGGCFHPSVQVWTEKGMIPIGRIVNERLPVRVWSYDFSSREFVLRPVVSWFRNTADGIGRSSFKGGGKLCGTVPLFGPTTLWGTETHQVYNLSGEKGDLGKSSELVAATENLSYSQRQVLLGSLLGDGTIPEKGHLAVRHCEAQRAYCEWKSSVFGSLSNGVKPGKAGVLAKSPTNYGFRTKDHDVFRAARALWYPLGEKIIPDQALTELDALGLAIWFLDDGSTVKHAGKNTEYCTLSTHCFCRQDVEKLRATLSRRWGIASWLGRDESIYGGRDIGYTIQFAGDGANRLLNLIAPYVPESMQYKLGKKPESGACVRCGAPVLRRQELCVGCLLSEARALGTSKLPKHIRRRLGGTAAVRALLSSGEVPVQLTGAEAWFTRMASAGSLCAQVSQDHALTYSLVTLPAIFEKGKGRRWENTRTVYDIEVAGTHSYFANGILVSNSRFGHITLSEPFPQPVMEPTIKTLLGLTGPEFDSVVSGESPVGKFGTGGAGIKAALSAINVDRELNLQKEMFRSQQGPKRDLAAKKIRALTALKDTGVKPGDLVVTKIPVLPPIFRPVSSTAKFDLVSGTNQLYQYLMHSDSNMKELKAVGGLPETEARATTYKMLRALVGLDAPPMRRLQEQNVRGILADITGTSPKFGTFQKKLLGATVDMSGRGAISGDAAMGMDEIGVPEAIAWDVFMPYTIGRMVREFGGDSEAKARAMREYADKTERAKAAMVAEMEDRPVLSSRAPALHRYSILAFRPRLVAGDSIRMSPYTVTGFGADYDGNCVDYDSEISLYISKSSPKVETAQFRAFKESIMLANGKVQVLTDGSVSAIIKIGDMPRLGDPVKDKNGADVYEVPKGVFVLSYDQEKNEHVYSPVRHLTVENDCQTVTVATKRYEVIVSDNESLAVFDPATGQVSKRAPKDSLRMFCPTVQSDTVFGASYDFDTGWLYGALISDGWVGRDRQVGYSKNDKGLRERVVDLMRRKISPNFTVNEYITEKGQPGKFGKSAKIHMNGKDVVHGLLPFVAPDPGDGKRAALRKFIPKELLLGGSKEALWGLLSGLMDGDATFSVSKKVGNPKANNYCIFLLTSSPELRDDMRWLLMKLGIRAATGVAKFKDTRSDAYTLTLSAVDIYNARNDIRLYGKKGADGLRALVERADTVPLRDNTDIIPLSLAEAEAARPWLSPQDRGEVRNNMVATRAWLAEKLEAAGEDPELSSLFARVRSTEVRWERVISVEDAGKRQVFDLEVLGTKVFVVNAGLVIWDTMNIYAPASPSAVREAYEKLLPSKNLISPADFGPVIMPRQEYLEGLWRASAKKPKDQAVTYFNTTEDLQKAYANGQIDLDDPVRVLDLKTS